MWCKEAFVILNRLKWRACIHFKDILKERLVAVGLWQPRHSGRKVRYKAFVLVGFGGVGLEGGLAYWEGVRR